MTRPRPLAVALAALVGALLAVAVLFVVDRVTDRVPDKLFVIGLVIVVVALSALVVPLIPAARRPVAARSTSTPRTTPPEVARSTSAPRTTPPEVARASTAPRTARPTAPAHVPEQPATPPQATSRWPDAPDTATSASGSDWSSGWSGRASSSTSPAWRPAPKAVEDEASGRQPESLAVPVPGSRWWEAAGNGATTPGVDRAGSSSGPPEGPPVDLSEYGPIAHVVQCPRCGDFAVDLVQEQAEFRFDCRRCRHKWRWQPGSPWPATVVRPRLRGADGFETKS